MDHVKGLQHILWALQTNRYINFFSISVCGSIPTTYIFLPNLKSSEGIIFFLSNTIFMNTCSFTMHFKKISALSKVFVECKICIGELAEASSSFQLASLTPQTSPNT